ncbi:MAG TPA: hypothetical protein VFO67_13775, partial [Gemmatimonadales bacterium]|nr:hypothetical protein [Gemmatimonadales bacterium]
GHLNVHQDSASRHDAGNSCAEDSPLELLLRGGTDVDFMTPVKIELRLRNLSPRPLRIDARLQCSDGNVTVSIRGRDDKIVEYVPMTHRLRGALLKDLAPAATAEPFLDRYSEELDLTYGRGGFYFDKPGEYVLQATYVGHDRRTVRSNTLRLLIARPDSADETRAQDFFSHDVGKCLYLQGSHSPHLRKGLDVLREAVDRREGTAAGARLAESIAKGIADPFFFRIEKDGNGESERRDKPPDPEAALKFSEPAVAVFQSSTDRTVNLAHGRLARARCDWKRALRRVEEGHRELEIQLSVLEARGVHKSVLDELRSYLNSFFESQS